MRQDKLLSITFAAIAIAGGVYCVLQPGLAVYTVASIVGLAMLFNALASLMTWFARRAVGVGDPWLLATAIVALVTGLLVWGTGMAKIAVMMLIIVLLVIWLIGEGVFYILHGLRLRSLHVSLGTEYLGSRWWLLLAGGVLLIVVGVLSIVFPTIAAESLVSFMGICLIAGGIVVIANTFAE